MPASEGRPAFLLDMASHTPWDEDCFRRMPQVFLKAIGISHVANLLSGTLGGQMLPEFDRQQVAFKGADQSGFHLALDIARFTSVPAFLADVDRLMAETSRMKPLPGFAESTLPGGRAWQKEREYLAEGIPVGVGPLTELEELATEFGLTVPWR
jgi:LDH2 family malate/lactate/ureidoglycolate dehydrogenase